MRLPYFIRKNGTGMKRKASPPRSADAPGVPSFAYIWRAAGGEGSAFDRLAVLFKRTKQRESGSERAPHDCIDSQR